MSQPLSNAIFSFNRAKLWDRIRLAYAVLLGKTVNLSYSVEVTYGGAGTAQS